jgi:hypothetical protein
VYSSGIPTSNYQPSSTIPLQHNYHLPSSQLAQSSTPYTQQIATQQIAPQQINGPLLNKNYGSSSGFNSGLQTQNNGIQDQSWNSGLQTQNYGPSSGLNSGLQTQNYGIQDQSWNNGLQTQNQSNIPTPPALPNWNRSRSWRTQRSVRPLRTRDWGHRTDNGWSNFKYQTAVEESFLRNRAVPAPHPPPMPSMLRPRKWHSGPYRQQRNLRTRNWGNRNGDGWANFNRGIYAHESALPLYVSSFLFSPSICLPFSLSFLPFIYSMSPISPLYTIFSPRFVSWFFVLTFFFLQQQQEQVG